jgi:hypothetical protein
MRDEKKKIEQYRERRTARLKKRGICIDERLDSVDEYRARRERRLLERNYRKFPKTIDKSSAICYDKNRRNDADDTINGEEVDWRTLENKKKIAINGEGEIVAGPNQLKGKSVGEVRETAKQNEQKKQAQKAAQSPEAPKEKPSPEEEARAKAEKERIEAEHKKKATEISGSFLKQRGFKKGAKTFTGSIKEALDHGMSEEKIASVLNNLKPEDIYEINGEHGVIGLASKIDDEVVNKSSVCQDIWEKAKNNGTPITNDVLDITKSLGASMSGLEFAVKAGKSTSEKIDRDHADYKKDHDGEQDPRTDEEVLGGLNDLVRYTQVSEHDKIAENAEKTMQALKDRGYKIVVCKNRYASEKPLDYYDIKIIAQNKDGQNFELQFHSKESLDVKDKNHALYEIQRKVETPENEKIKLGEQMMANSAQLKKPAGYERIPNFDLLKEKGKK